MGKRRDQRALLPNLWKQACEAYMLWLFRAASSHDVLTFLSFAFAVEVRQLHDLATAFEQTRLEPPMA